MASAWTVVNKDAYGDDCYWVGPDGPIDGHTFDEIEEAAVFPSKKAAEQAAARKYGPNNFTYEQLKGDAA